MRKVRRQDEIGEEQNTTRRQATKVPILPVEMDGQRFGTRLNIPRAGEHTRELLAGLGYAEAEIDELVSKRIVAVG